MSHVTHEEVTEARDTWMSHITMPFRDLLASWDCGVSHIWNESHHIWMSHVSYEWATESCHVWKSHVTYGWVTSRCPLAASSPPRIVQGVTCGTSHITYERVTSHMNEPRSHVTYKDSRDVWMSHVTMHLATSSPCGIVRWVTHETRHILYQMSHVLHQMRHVIFEWVTWHINESHHSVL